jgi:hypothetical protein
MGHQQRHKRRHSRADQVSLWQGLYAVLGAVDIVFACGSERQLLQQALKCMRGAADVTT